MTQETLNVLNELKKDGRQNPIINIVLGIVVILSFVCFGFFASSESAEPNRILGLAMLCEMIAIPCLLFRGIYALQRNMSLKKSLITMEKTGSIRYVSEILNKQYKTTGKEWLSEHIYYIPGTLILAYEDMSDIKRVNSEYFFLTNDGKRHRIMTWKAKKDTIEYLLNTYKITSGASYKYKYLQ